MKKLRILFYFSVLTIVSLISFSSPTHDRTESPYGKKIFTFHINQEIGPAAWRLTQKCFAQAEKYKADVIIIQMNTYGGMLDAADSIRTKILHSKIPVWVFINNNAASAGALISIACDSVFMTKSANFGAATVVNEKGEVVADKYQSYMRSMMRSTAQSHGKVTKIVDGDTVVRWFRDPIIAEAMVDPRTKVKGLDSGKVVTFTATEAIKFNYCEGEATDLKEVIKLAGVQKYEIKEYTATSFDKLMGWLLSPVLQGILIMMMVGGIYFEMQSPGSVIPISIAAMAAVVYFAPLYLEGIAAYWEIIMFVVGVIIVIAEVFIVPTFGVLGIIGIVMIISGLALAMVENVSFEYNSSYIIFHSVKSFAIVTMSLFISIILSISMSNKMLKSKTFNWMVLNSGLKKDDGFVSGQISNNELVGRIGVVVGMLRPSGKVEIDDEMYDATCEVGFIERGEKVKVVRYESGQLYVKKIV